MKTKGLASLINKKHPPEIHDLLHLEWQLTCIASELEYNLGEVEKELARTQNYMSDRPELYGI